jgi:Amylo-alpha-1,6-glucosidase
MRVRHILSDTTVRRDIAGTRSFFLRSPLGYVALRPERNSRYEGWFWEDPSTPAAFLKILEAIEYVKGEDAVEPELSGMTVTEDAAFWEYGDGAKLGFKLAPQHAGLQVRAGRPVRLRLTLDIRKTYEHPEFERAYEVTRVAGGLVVKYSDPTLERPVYLHIATDGLMTLDGTWKEVSYPWDARRNSFPSSMHAYVLGEVTTEKLSFGIGWTADEAQAACHAAAHMPLETIGFGPSFGGDDTNDEIRTALSGAERALEWLTTPAGTYAGLPWFHQVWSRDELIAGLGMNEDGRRSILQRYVGLPLEKGELPTFTGSGTTCADGVGWFCLLLREHGIEDLSEGGAEAVITFLKDAVRGLRAERMENGLVNSGHNATWMDTIGRVGCRIEIQCMYALALELLARLSGDGAFEKERQSFLGLVREQFFKDGYLWDGHDDPRMRPNVFIAYLLQPELLTEEDWKSCFARAIAALSTPWGGFASLDKSDPAYKAESSGQDNLSYHNGDSWFFVNNLSAVALRRLDARVYSQTIARLIESSVEETLWKNFAGLPGEIASAQSGESWGCGIQAFSAGAFVLLARELGY